MNDIMDENVIVEEYKFNKPPIQKIYFLIDNSIRDCHNKYFHTFDHVCEYDFNFTNISNNETVNFTISDECIGIDELNQKLAIACGNGFMFDQISTFKIKTYSNLSQINIHYYLNLRIPIMHRQFFRKLSQNPEYNQTHCNDRRNPFHFACRKWYSHNNPQKHCSILTLIRIQDVI